MIKKKACRLKIIIANIKDNIDSPSIQYISQNKEKNKSNESLIINKKHINYNEEKIVEQIDENQEKNLKESQIINQIQLEELMRYDLINNSIDNNNEENINNNIEHNNRENLNKNAESKIIRENMNSNKEINNREKNSDKKIINYYDNFDNYLKNNNENKEENSVDINKLYTISNKQINDDNKNFNTYNFDNSNNKINISINDYINNNNINNENNNYRTVQTYYNTVYNNNYPYNIECKKKELNITIRHLFKNRETNPHMARNLSSVKNKNKNKNILFKNIIFSKSNNSNSRNNKNIYQKSLQNQNNNSDKSNNAVNIKINKSFSINNFNDRYDNSSNHSKKKVVIKSRNKDKNINNIKKNSQMKSRQNNFLNETNLSSISWNIIEKSEFDIDHTLDYKLLIDDLIIKECQLVKEKENIIQTNEKRLKPLRELNQKLMIENTDEIDREDELNGELTVLKYKYEKLFSILYPNNSNNNINSKNIKNSVELNDKIKEIDKEINILNENLNKGEILLITKPANLENLTNDEDKEVTLMLKGLFASIHVFDTDKIVDIIWKFDKPLQTIYFLIEEFLYFFKLEPNSEKNILINYFYSFCKIHNYMHINTFKSLFKKKIGKIQIYNKDIYISKLINFHHSKIDELINLMKNKDIYNIKIIKYDQFKSFLFDTGLYLNSKKDQESQEYLEFLVFCMKKDRTLELKKYKKQINKKNKKNNDNDEIKYSLFDLYYGSLIDFLDEYNSTIVKNPFKRIRTYMKNNNINNAEIILRPILIEKNIIKINNIEYIDIILLNKYFRRIGIILNEEKIFVPLFEEELVDKKKFINDIYNYENNEEESSPEKIKQKADDFIDEIFGIVF